MSQLQYNEDNLSKITRNKAKKFKNSNFGEEVDKLCKEFNSFTINDGKKFEERVSRRVKRFTIHRLVRFRKGIYSMFKNTDLDGFKKHYNINSTNRVVGYTPEYVGPTPSVVVSARNYICEFLSDNFQLIKSKVSSSCFKDLMSSSIESRVTYSAGFTSAYSHLKEYLKDNSTDVEWTHDNIIEIVELSRFKWFRSPVVEFYNSDEIFSLIRTNPDAYSGHYTSKIFGRYKRSSDVASRYISRSLWNIMKTSSLKNFCLWDILGREKDIKVDGKDEEFNQLKDVGTRVVLTTENPMTTLLMWFAQKMSFVLMHSDWDKTYNIDREFNNYKYNKLLDHEEHYDYILEADWSFFDSNIDTNFLEVACFILCNSMPKDELHKNISYLITSSVVSKYIVIPPGVVVELNRAQPSGHPFGTLVNCNVNLIYWCLIGYKIYGKNYSDNMRVEVYGDDTRAYFKSHKNLFRLDEIVESIGLKSDSLIPNLRSVNENCQWNYKIDYLKRRFDLNVIKWNHKKMFDRLIYQSKNRSLDEQIEQFISYFKSVPSDEDCLILNKMFSSYILSKGYKISYLNERSLKDILKVKFTPSINFDHWYYESSIFNQFNKHSSLYSEVIYFRNDGDDVSNELNNKKINLLYLLHFSFDYLDLPDNLKIIIQNRPPPGFFNSERRINCYKSFWSKQIAKLYYLFDLKS